jgi:hypothetical protein
MSPLPVLLLLGVSAWAIAGKKPASNQASKAASQAPADANALLASMLAPSLTSATTLADMFKVFIAAAQNQTGGDRKLRLMQYALATFLKMAMLSKGAQPDANELAMIACAPIDGGKGLIGYGDVGVDTQTAIANALQPTFTDVGGLGQYLQSFATAYNTAKPGAERRRLLAFIYALKAKQVALNQGGYNFPAENYFALANLASADVPTTTAPNSIISLS